MIVPTIATQQYTAARRLRRGMYLDLLLASAFCILGAGMLLSEVGFIDLRMLGWPPLVIGALSLVLDVWLLARRVASIEARTVLAFLLSMYAAQQIITQSTPFTWLLAPLGLLNLVWFWWGLRAWGASPVR